MEEIYPPDSYGASGHICLKEYFDSFSEALGSEITTVYGDGAFLRSDFTEAQYLCTIKELMDVDISYNDIAHLSEACDTKHLTCEGEDRKYPVELPKTVTVGTKLSTPFFRGEANNLMVHKWQSKVDSTQKDCTIHWARRKNYINKLDFNVPQTPPDLLPGSDFILSVLVYKPVAFKFFSSKNASENLRFNHEILILGRNTLDELRDAIVCSADFGLCKEVESTTSDLKPLADARNIYPSGFIFIDDVFYNDFRHPDAIDYSAPIMEWCKEKQIMGLKTEAMENVTINSLTPRFGYPYLYMHQGDCEHLIVFSDAKLVDSGSCLHSQCYPHLLRINRHSNIMCFMCTAAFAKWICVGSDRLPQHKVFLCTDCCNAYNYVDGHKLGNFKLYPYYEKHVVI